MQASGDGEAIVFHDYELGRLTDAHGKLAEMDAAALGAIPLKGESEALPTLAEILALIAGRAPLLIEVKSPGRRVAALSGAVARRARRLYRPGGGHVLQSRGPALVRAPSRPSVLRGLVVTEEGRARRATG